MKPTVLRVVSNPRPAPTDLQTMRKRERQYVEEGVVTSGHAADRIAERVLPLPGEPNCFPIGLAIRNHAGYVEDVTRTAMNTLREMIKEDLISECLSIESYRETFGYRVERDPTTRLLDEMLADDENIATTFPGASRDGQMKLPGSLRQHSLGIELRRSGTSLFSAAAEVLA